jgi:hypothetical protein
MKLIISDEEILKDYDSLKYTFEAYTSVELLERFYEKSSEFFWILVPVAVPYFFIMHRSIKKRIKNMANKYPEHFL